MLKTHLRQIWKDLYKWLPALLWAGILLLLYPYFSIERPISKQPAMDAACFLLVKSLLLSGLAGLAFRIPAPLPRRKGLLSAALANLLIILGLAGVGGHLHEAVFQQYIPLDFDHFFQLEAAGGVALIGILLLAISVFLLSHRLLWFVVRAGVPQRQRLLGMLIAVAVFGAFLLLKGSMLHPLQVLLTGIAYVALMDIYIERQTSSLTWALFWAVAFSAWLALLLFQFNLRVDRLARLDIAREFATSPAEDWQQADKYDYVIFQGDGAILTVHGNPNGNLAQHAGAFAEGQWKEYFSAARADLVYRGADGLTLVIGRATGGYRKPIALFSGIFALLSLLVLLLAGFNHMTRFVSPDYDLPLCGPPSLRNRIQLATIASILGSFLAIGLLSAAYYQRSSSPELQEETRLFISALLNLYVFLLLVAAAAALYVSNSITKPLSEIGQKLAGIKLGKNEPISWKNKDELGELIGAYNRMLETLEESTERLKLSEREGAWREMARQVAHEIKNPLTPMKLSVQHLLRAYQTQPENAQALLQRVSQTLIEQIDVLSGIASEFSNFAKMPEPQCERLEINDLLRSVYTLFATQENLNVAFELDLPEKLLFVFADRNQLTRVFTNLVKNAIQAIPDDRKGQVSIRLSESGADALICVEDNGAGIPKTVYERVFSPYFTTKSSGTGLGLAMCKNMIEAMNGHIWFESEAGEGTRFFVNLKMC